MACVTGCSVGVLKRPGSSVSISRTSVRPARSSWSGRSVIAVTAPWSSNPPPKAEPLTYRGPPVAWLRRFGDRRPVTYQGRMLLSRRPGGGNGRLRWPVGSSAFPLDGSDRAGALAHGTSSQSGLSRHRVAALPGGFVAFIARSASPGRAHVRRRRPKGGGAMTGPGTRSPSAGTAHDVGGEEIGRKESSPPGVSPIGGAGQSGCRSALHPAPNCASPESGCGEPGPVAGSDPAIGTQRYSAYWSATRGHVGQAISATRR